MKKIVKLTLSTGMEVILTNPNNTATMLYTTEFLKSLPNDTVVTLNEVEE